VALSSQRRESLLLLAFGGLALVPLFWNLSLFKDLFPFGDEWDQLDQINQHGFWSWVISFFGENFAPLFKLTWGTGLLLGGGSYFVLVVICWLVHAANVVLLGRWLRQTGFGWAGTLFAMAVLGLTVANLETLAWTVQLLTLQGMALFLAAAIHLEKLRQVGAPARPTAVAALVGLILASTLSFVRGILTGGALAAAQLWPMFGSAQPPLARRWRLAAICLLPSVAIAVLILLFTGGNQQPAPAGSGGVAVAAPAYALWYFSLNPFHRLLEVDSWGWRTCALLAAGKLALLSWAFGQATPAQRRLLVTVLAFDLGTAALLGIGRYHTGLETAHSSRYQYTSLICTLPFLAVWIDAWLARWVRSNRSQLIAGILLALLAGAFVSRHWAAEMQAWSGWRGRDPRRLLEQHAGPADERIVPGIPAMPADRAKELIKRYNLH
jgi:hypothetical protein